MAVIVGLVAASFTGSAVADQGVSPEGVSGQPALLDVISLILLGAIPVVLWLGWKKDVIRPGSFSRHHRRMVRGTPWAVFWIATLGMISAQMLGSMLGSAALQLLKRPAGPGEMPPADQAIMMLVAGLVTIAGGGLLFWILRNDPRTGASRAGLELVPRRRDFAIGAMGLAMALPIANGVAVAAAYVSRFVTGHEPDPLAHDTLKIIRENPGAPASLGLIVAAVFIAPIAEEMLFRGVLQSAVLRSTGRVWLSIFITAMLFAGIHLGGGVRAEDVHALVPLLALGVCLGIAFERTGRLWVPITMHVLFNAFNIALTLVM